MTLNCHHQGCTNAATHIPKLCVPALHWAIHNHRPLSVLFDMPLCDEHVNDIRMPEILDPVVNAKLRHLFEIMCRGKQPPDFTRAFVLRARLDSDEVKKFRELQTAKSDETTPSPPPAG